MSDFEQRIQSDLHTSELDLDQDVRDRLQGIRRQTLAAPTSRWNLRRFVWPTAGMALASLVVVVMIFNTTPVINSEQSSVKEKYSDSFELYENLDFYYWLANGENDIRG